MIKDSIEYNKNWYLKNKEKHLAYVLAKVECDCGRVIARCHIAKHARTPLHTRCMEKKKLESRGNIEMAEMRLKIKQLEKDLENKV